MGLDLDGAVCAGKPMVIAAPWPEFRLVHQSARDGVAMHVLEFLDELRLGEDVEVVVIQLPEAWTVAFELFRCLRFESTEDAAEGGLGWFAQ